MFRRFVGGVVAVLVAGALSVAAAGTAGAGTIPRSGATKPATTAAPSWGAPCPTVGADGYTPGGTHLVCQQRKGDDCPRWHSAGPSKRGTGWKRPVTPPCVCDSASPAPSSSPSGSPSASPSVSTPVSPASSTAAVSPPAVVGAGGYAHAGGGGELPVTGVPVAGLVGLAVLLVAVGVLLLVRWRGLWRRVG